jgi:autotransporter-associated beta strand protein
MHKELPMVLSNWRQCFIAQAVLAGRICRKVHTGQQHYQPHLETLEARLVLQTHTHTWNGSLSNRWSDPGNWNEGSPAGDPTPDLVFPPGVMNLAINNDITDSIQVVRSITFLGGGYSVTGNPIHYNDGDTLTITDMATGGNTFNPDIYPIRTGPRDSLSPLVVAVESPGETLGLGGSVLDLDAITTLGLTKSGPGTVVIFGANTYSGGTTLQDGTLSIANDSALGTGTLTLNAGIMQSSGNFTVANTYTLGGAATIGGNNNITLSGPGTLGAGNTMTVANSATTTLSGILGGAGNILEAAGSGKLVLAGSNTYTGSTTVTSGLLTVSNNSALGTSTLTLNGGSIQSSTSVTLANAFLVSGSSTVAGSNNILFTGAGSLGNATTLIVSNSGITTIAGELSGAGGLTVMTKAGTLVLSPPAPNTYTGPTLINAGTLQLGASDGVPSTSDVTVASGGTFDLLAYNDTIGSLTGAGTAMLGMYPMTLTTNGNNRSTMFSGIISGIGGLTKAGAGMLTLSGNNTYGGDTTVVEGTLLVNGMQPLSKVTVEKGATLGGSGTVGAIVATGIVSPGGPGTATAIFNGGNATFNRGSSFAVTLNGPNLGSQYDQLEAKGTVDLSGSPRLNVSVNFPVPLGTSFTILSAASITGMFDRLPNNAVLVAGGQSFLITYEDASVVLTRGQGGTNTTLVSTDISWTPDQPVYFTATITPSVPGEATPTGTVQFRLGGRNIDIPVPLSSSGGLATASLPNSIPVSSVDGQIVSASYSGDSNFLGSSASLDPDRFFVMALYSDLLRRPHDDGGLQFWVAQLHGGMSRTRVAMDFWVSDEHRGDEVDEFYGTILHRTADSGGRQYWVSQLEAGVPESQVALAFATSEEYRQKYPDSPSFVDGLYNDLLKRDGQFTDNEVTSWVQTLQNGASRGEVAYSFLSSEEAFQKAIDEYYSVFLGRSESQKDLQAWLVVLEGGRATPLSVASAFMASNEYLARALNNATSSE